MSEAMSTRPIRKPRAAEAQLEPIEPMGETLTESEAEAIQGGRAVGHHNPYMEIKMKEVLISGV